jgi:hypothetical protein
MRCCSHSLSAKLNFRTPMELVAELALDVEQALLSRCGLT